MTTPFRIQQLKNKLLSKQMEYSLETVELMEKELEALKTENEHLRTELRLMAGDIKTLAEMIEK